MTSPIETAIFDLLSRRGPGKSICPSEAARAVDPQGWRRLMPQVRAAAVGLARVGRLEITRKGRVADPDTLKGVYRLRSPGTQSSARRTPEMIVYGSSLSPFVRKVLVICAEKGIEVENRVSRPGEPPPEGFLEASPFKKIPALRDGAFTLPDSTAIAVYLDAKHPEPQLIPTEPQARGRTLWFDEFADTVSVPSKVKVFFNRVVAPLVGRPADEEMARKAETDELPDIFAYLERTIPPSGYLVEDRFTLADIAVASPFVNLRHAKSPADAGAYPKLTAYLAAIHARPSFAALIGKDDAFLERARAR